MLSRACTRLYFRMRACLNFFGQGSTTLAKTVETTARTWRRRVTCGACTTMFGLCGCLIFFCQGSTFPQHGSCKCPTLTGSSAKTTTPLFFVQQGFDDKRKINIDPLAIHDGLAAAQRRSSGTPQAGACASFFRCSIARLTAAQLNCTAPVPSLRQKSPDMP